MIFKFKNYIPDVHDSCFIAPGSSVIGQVSIGRDSSVWHNTVLRGDMAPIRIGEKTNIQDGSVLHSVKDVEVRVGNNVTVGHGAILHSCTIGDETLIGMGAIVLDGAKIGRNCLIGAGSVVVPKMEIPDCSLVMGSPARIKRLLTAEEISHIKNNAEEYVKLAIEHRKSLQE